MRFLITAGPTREPIDPVRFISNRSTGKMGYCLALSAKTKGHKVILISGPSLLVPPKVNTLVRVETCRDMQRAVKKHIRQCDVLIMCAAPGDYRPRKISKKKIKKTSKTISIDLVRNPDILGQIAQKKGKNIFVAGFALETHKAIQNAKRKLISKKLDMLVLNDLSKPGAGFGTGTNRVVVFYKDGTMHRYPVMKKEKIANKILDDILKNILYNNKIIPAAQRSEN